MRPISLLLFLLLSFSFLYSQELRVQHFSIDGELTLDDPISQDMGRISAAVKLNFSKGDYFSSKLTADFVPLLVLVAPSGEYKICYPDQETIEAKFDGRIDETGEWLLYIVGDTTDTGSYLLENKYASADAMNFDTNNDYCQNINLLLEHLEADFYFLKGVSLDESNVEYKSKVSFPGVEEATIFGHGDEWFKAVLFSGDQKSYAENIFSSTESSITDCLGKDWAASRKSWANIMGAEGSRQKVTIFSAKDGSGRYLKLSILENFNDENGSKPYSVEVMINKER